MKTKDKLNLLKLICIVCASALFIAVFYWSITYYTLLRIIVFIGAILVMLFLNKKQLYWSLMFLLVAIFFNPIFPIYLYVKAYWIPFDIITGILFLLVGFIKEQKEKPEKKIKESKSYSRDRIY
nr:DUF6804 family protein [uncultured Psychroserpens sp.]